ncbi:MAG: ribosomal protein S18-alanine N-acetyltransferase [Oscillospiraceae bacterium]|nr:ribosomal protein S18-alanine N-acetyltransferase [Oscillospiraceae bacterium]
MLAILHARGEDIPRIREIAEASFPDPWSEESFRRELDADGVFYAAHSEGRLDGYLVLRSMGLEYEVLDVAVAPEARRTGIGEALIATAVQYAREHGAEKVWLEVRAGNVPALGLYEKYGFRRVGLRKNYYARPAEDAVLMERKLREA